MAIPAKLTATGAASGEATLRITRLMLTELRSYPRLVWHPSCRLSVVHGPNGSGKTNLLEGISLLAPGRGLRNARLAEVGRRESAGIWSVAARLDTPQGPVDLGSGVEPGGGTDGGGTEDGGSLRRVFRLDGAPARTPDVAARFAAVWLTPQMERLFQEGASGRRRFLDRLVYALDPGHARAVGAHDQAVAERNRLLAADAERGWLDAIEDTLARHAVAVSAARLGLAARLNAALKAGVAAPFPPTRLSVTGPVADLVVSDSAVAVEAKLRDALARGRIIDRAAGSGAIGAHRDDLLLADAAGLFAAQASTGEQKAMLVGVVLGHAALIAGARGFAPVLLLDEPAAHLDAGRRAALFAALRTLPAQAILTGTDAETFLPLADVVENLRAGDGRLLPDARFRPA